MELPIRLARMPRHLAPVSLLCLAGGLAGPADLAWADTFAVRAFADGTDAAPGDGRCVTAGGACTLRAAIQESNALAGADAIVLRAGRYQLTITGPGEDAARSGDLDVTSALTITGAGARRTVIDANAGVGGIRDRGLHVHPGARARVFRLTLTNGHVRGGGDGGGALIQRGTLELARVRISRSSAGDLGGGVHNDRGLLEARDSTFDRNDTDDDGGGIAADERGNRTVLLRVKVRLNQARGDGGGIEIEGGDLSLVDSTVSGNRTLEQDGGGIEINDAVMRGTGNAIFGNTAFDNGGGIENDTGSVTLINTTISGNTARKRGGGVDQTRADPQTGSGLLRMTHVTIRGNTAGLDGGGVSNRPGSTVRMRNSIVAANLVAGGVLRPPRRQDCGGTAVTSRGSNLASDGTCDLTQASDLASTDPLLGPLAFNGGPTRTHALLPGSPAIDAAEPNRAPTDQRGVRRPRGPGADMGAFER